MQLDLKNDRTPEELSRYVKRLEELAWKAVGSTEEYELVMQDAHLNQLTYVEALERLILERRAVRTKAEAFTVRLTDGRYLYR